VRLDRDVFPEGEVRGGVLGLLPISLAFLRAVDVPEADTFRMGVVQDVLGDAEPLMSSAAAST
jgi:hypothetical protein